MTRLSDYPKVSLSDDTTGYACLETIRVEDRNRIETSYITADECRELATELRMAAALLEERQE